MPIQLFNPFGYQAPSAANAYVPVDFSVIGAAGLKVKPGLAALGQLQGQLKDRIDIPPWRLPAEPTKGPVINKLLSNDPLITAPDLTRVRSNEQKDIQNLFALYRGLAKMGDLTNYAATDKAATGQFATLDKQFQKYMGELKKFIGETDFNGIDVVLGVKESSMRASVATKSQLSYTQGASFMTDRTSALPFIDANSKFTITTNNNGTVKNIAIDLNNAGGVKNIDDVVGYINGELAFAGVVTRFEVTRFNAESYGIKINQTTGIETVTLTADAATQEGAAYMVGQAGTGTNSGAFLMKFDDLANTEASLAWRRDLNTSAADSGNQVITGADGYSYVVGTSQGGIGGEIASGQNDAFLAKYDPAGNLVWSHLLGGATDTKGLAVSVDSSGNVVIAGQTTAKLSGTAIGGGTDTFVTKLNSDGLETWTRQIAPGTADGALGVTVDSSGNIFVSGYTDSALAGQTAVGGRDAYVTKLDGTGALVYNNQFGTVGGDLAKSVAVDNAGNVFVMSQQDGNVVVSKYADAAGAGATWSVNLGALGDGGALGGLTVSGGKVYVGGTTANAALAGTTVTAHSGGLDGFLTQITDSGGSAAIDYTTYVGTAANDEVAGVRVDGAGNVYLAGSTAGSLGAALSAGGQDAFMAKFDSAGARQYVNQVGGPFAMRATGISFDSTGTDILSRLGLPRGEITPGSYDNVVQTTSARADQYFTVQVDDGTIKRVSVGANDTWSAIATKIQSALGINGSARMKSTGDGKQLQIEALNGHKITIGAGAAGSDALRGLGIRATTLIGTPYKGDREAEARVQSNFYLGLTSGTTGLKDIKAATDAQTLVEDAMRAMRKAYSFIKDGPEDPEALKKALAKSGQSGAFTAYESARMSQMRGALARLGGAVA